MSIYSVEMNRLLGTVAMANFCLAKFSSKAKNQISLVKTSHFTPVKYNQQEHNLPLLVDKVNGHSLFGRNCFYCIKLNWDEIHEDYNNSLKTVLDHHSAVLQEGQEKLIGYKTKITLHLQDTPWFCKAKSVLYALKIKE